MGIAEIIAHVANMLQSVIVLVLSALTLSAIDKVEDTAGEYGVEYKDADKYRWAAGWLVFVSAAAILYHTSAMVIRILYIRSVIGKHFNLYVHASAVLCIFFISSSLLGVIANFIFAKDNENLWNGSKCERARFYSTEFCQILQSVAVNECYAAIASSFSSLVFAILFIHMIMIFTPLREPSSDERSHLLSATPPAYVHSPSYKSCDCNVICTTGRCLV